MIARRVPAALPGAMNPGALVLGAAAVGAALLWTGPAAAQFGIFGGDQPPRPPSAVPARPAAPAQSQNSNPNPLRPQARARYCRRGRRRA